ncbi:MAG: permease [Halothiobacillaceae bacterium]
MEWLIALVAATLGVALDAAPWLLLGLVLAGLLKGFLPEAWMVRWVGSEGLGAVVRAALVGAPLPLCSCSVLPTALGLRRQGAGKGPTFAFMIATPETGGDSVAVTYALLGPVYAVLRPLGALISAVAVGWVACRMSEDEGHPSAGSACATGCYDTGCAMPSPPPPSCDAGCAGGCPPSPSHDHSVLARTVEGVRYALASLWETILHLDWGWRCWPPGRCPPSFRRRPSPAWGRGCRGCC